MATQLDPKTIAVLKHSGIINNVVILPNEQLERDEYEKVAHVLNKLGGKWNRKKGGFLFDFDPTARLAEVLEAGKPINLQQQFQTFYTPPALAARMAEMLDIQLGDCVTDPGGGRGALIQACLDLFASPGYFHMNTFELMPENYEFLAQKYPYPVLKLIGRDFLQTPEDYRTDKVIANPPFKNNQDIDHIGKMWEITKPGGKIVTIASTAWTFGETIKQTAFRNFVNKFASLDEELPRGTFSESGTEVPARLLVFNKR